MDFSSVSPLLVVFLFSNSSGPTLIYITVHCEFFFHQPRPATWLGQGQSLSSPMKYLASSCECGCRPRCKGERQCSYQTGADLSSSSSACCYSLAQILGRKRNHDYTDGKLAGTNGCPPGEDASTVGDSVMWRALTTACMRLEPRVNRWEMGVRGLLCCGRERKNAKEQKIK
jgi:hypothetical protein